MKGVKLLNSSVILNARAMADGDLGEIVEWDGHNYVGRIVQRNGDNLISIGLDSGNTWTGYFADNSDRYENPKCKVRILKKGEQIEVI